MQQMLPARSWPNRRFSRLDWAHGIRCVSKRDFACMAMTSMKRLLQLPRGSPGRSAKGENWRAIFLHPEV